MTAHYKEILKFSSNEMCRSTGIKFTLSKRGVISDFIDVQRKLTKYHTAALQIVHEKIAHFHLLKMIEFRLILLNQGVSNQFVLGRLGKLKSLNFPVK